MQVALLQRRLHAELGDHARILDRAVERAALDLILEHEPDRDAEGGHDDDAHAVNRPSREIRASLDRTAPA